MVLLSIDAGFFGSDNRYLSQAKKILETHRLTWPSIFLPGGWNDAVRLFNVHGYTKVVLDGQGIVRGLNQHGAELERLLKQLTAKN